MARRRKHPGGSVSCRLRKVDTSTWPDPPMVPTVALRQCEKAETVEEVRAIVSKYLPRRDA